ncbi:hypothetical protein AB8A05_06110 [Tardiphaga sp. 538_B7_N1_4]|uniref:hypothetical protein n=1 Tax=Tardiphaga sp. 538_B7_N1_4 TaxID=3240778 RepID=UPI003F26F49D
MDADFNISGFRQFINDGEYTLDYGMPSRYLDHMFSVGDPCPIVFWIDGDAQVIEGDAEAEALFVRFGDKARKSDVLVSLGGMLDDARKGKFKAQQEEWLATEIETAFSDVFLEAPSRTRYWISRYRAALENARKLVEPPHPIDVRLRRASSEWLSKFATKAELPMIASILGEASQGVYSVNQIAEIVFAYVCHRITTARSSEIKLLASDLTIQSLIPQGLYNYYISEGWPHVPFDYNRPDFIQLAKDRIVKDRAKRSWKASLSLSRLLFGNKAAPAEVDELALSILNAELKGYKLLMKALDRPANRDGYYGELTFAQIAREAISAFSRVNDLSCVMHGDERANGIMMGGRFGVWPEEIAEVREDLAKWSST